MDKIKIQDAITRITEAYEMFGNGLFLGHSGGKDSQVILHLTKQVTDNFNIVHNVKPVLTKDMDFEASLTAMHLSTLEFLYTEIAGEHEVHFMPACLMEDFVEEYGFTCQVDGARRVEAEREGKSANIIRNGESISRSEMSAFEEHGIFDLSICYPILDWTDRDVFDYLTEHDIPISKEYEMNGELDHYHSGDMI